VELRGEVAPVGPRGFRASLARGVSAEAGELTISLSLWLAPSEAAVPVFVEEAAVSVELPRADAAASEDVARLDVRLASSVSSPTPPIEAVPAKPSSSPVLPALFLAMATTVVMGGIALSLIRLRRARDPRGPSK
jgi:hypothetical protein